MEPIHPKALRDALLRVPSMNATGRLPAIAAFHVQMRVRCTNTICPCQAPVDTVGTIKAIELCPGDRARWAQQRSTSIFVLAEMPTVLVQIDDNERDTGLGPGVIAVKAKMCEPFAVSVEIPSQGESTVTVGLRVIREQVPLTIVTAATLYTLQGTTATPGLIHHFKMPNRLSRQMKWIATYMALSRVESLGQLRSIGLTDAIRDLIDEGPPEGLLTRFLELFAEKSQETEKVIKETLEELGWLE